MEALVGGCMKSYYQKVISTFINKVSKTTRKKYELDLVFDPDKDFSRNRKLDMETLIKTIVFSSGKPIREELYDYFDYSVDTASSSAFVQQRAKLKPEAFEYVVKEFNKAYPCTETYKGFRLIAVDGSDLSISYDISDEETYVPNCEGFRGRNLIHINSAYDILNKRYVDTIITGSKHHGEQYSMYTMAERFDEKAIFIADRNYSTWNNMEHIIKAGQFFLVRVQDIHSRTSNLRKFNLPDSEFDLDVETILTTKATNEVKAHPDKYRMLSKSSTFDFVSKDNPYYPVKYRVVRFKIDGAEEYESVITNLDKDKFPADEIKKLYNLRWGIEISFRHLKYSADLSAIHARNRNSIRQEIWARILLYNLCMIMIQEAIKHKTKSLKYVYTVNITRCIHVIRDMAKRKGGIPPDLEKLLLNELLPIRPDRLDLRKVKNQSVVCFNYRFS
jgi:IS4 transposase